MEWFYNILKILYIAIHHRNTVMHSNSKIMFGHMLALWIIMDYGHVNYDKVKYKM